MLRKKLFPLLSLLSVLSLLTTFSACSSSDSGTTEDTEEAVDGSLAIGVGHFEQTLDEDGLTITNLSSFSEDCRSTGSLDCEGTPGSDDVTGDGELGDYIIEITCALPDITVYVCRDDETFTGLEDTDYECATTIDFDGADDDASTENDNYTFAADVFLEGVTENSVCTILWAEIERSDNDLGFSALAVDEVEFTPEDGADVESN